jgi:hypothetical protein
MFEGIKIRETLQDIIMGCEICQHIILAICPALLSRLKGKAPILERTGKLISSICQEVLIPVYF